MKRVHSTVGQVKTAYVAKNLYICSIIFRKEIDIVLDPYIANCSE